MTHSSDLSLWFWLFAAACNLFVYFIYYADWFIQRRDVGPPRMRILPGPYLFFLALFASDHLGWVILLAGLVAVLVCLWWLDPRAERKELSSWGESLNRGPARRQVRIIPDLSRRLAGKYPLLLPRVCLERLDNAEVDALLARQAAPRPRWPAPVALMILVITGFFGIAYAPPSLAPFLCIAGLLCLCAPMVWWYRRLDAQADAKAVQATGDPATYIQALVKADRIMQETPRRLRMSTWWLFPASLDARIAAIAPARGTG